MMNVPFSGNWFVKDDNHSTGPAITQAKTSAIQSSLKPLSLADFLQPLTVALSQKQPWVQDFGDDQIMLPNDLYEVLTTFSSMQSDTSVADQEP